LGEVIIEGLTETKDALTEEIKIRIRIRVTVRVYV
jgi:hypothetical protein